MVVAPLIVVVASPLRAAEIAVTTTSGELGGSGCSLREAITAANSDAVVGDCPAGNGADVIRLAPSTEYVLSAIDNFTLEDRNGTEISVPNGLPPIDTSISISGEGSTIRRAPEAAAFRILYVTHDGNLRLEGIRLGGGRTPDGDDEPSASGGTIHNQGELAIVGGRIGDSSTGASSESGQGGAIFNEATLTLINTIIQDSRTGEGGSGDGGAIWNGGDLTIEHSSVFRNRTGRAGAGAGTGGGVCNRGTFLLVDSEIRGNETGYGGAGGGGFGAGIYNFGHLRAVRCTLSENVAGGTDDGSGGGGGALANHGEAFLVNSTVSGNAAGFASAANGGSGGGIYNSGMLVLRSCTVTDNRAGATAFGGGDGGPGNGGGLANVGTATLQNTILASNFAENGPECVGELISLGWNLIGDPGDCVITGDLVGTSIDDYPRLGLLLAADGGPRTHALRATSPAVNAGDPAGCRDTDGTLLATDQRGVPRTIGGRCDIGAYELGPCSLQCPGDCDEDGRVSVDELLAGVQLALTGRGQCRRAYGTDGFVTIDRLIVAVHAAIAGCPPCD